MTDGDAYAFVLEFEVWLDETREMADSHFEEESKLRQRGDEILLRARDAGMSNRELAEALRNHAESRGDELPNRFSTQEIAAMVRAAERRLSQNVDIAI
jgi:hypothetical protein